MFALWYYPRFICIIPFIYLEPVIGIIVCLVKVFTIFDILGYRQRLQCRKVHLHCKV